MSIVLTMALAGCSSGGIGGGEADEPSLRRAVTDFWDEMRDGEPLRAYVGFASDSYRQSCSPGDFAASLLLIDDILGEGWRDAELRIESVEIDGTRGTVVSDFYLDDSPLGVAG